MNLRILRAPAALVFATAALLQVPSLAQTHAAPASPYGGTPVEEILVRVNDQVITTSDYDRAMKELDGEARQHGASMQEISEAHHDLLRNLIDQQLWLSKGKELGITGETELIKQLDEMRKKYNLESLDDLEKAAKEQGFNYEDFKANIRNGIITQEVMRDQVGRKLQVTPGEVERYFQAHKQDYAQQESERLSEILVATPTPAPSATLPGGVEPDDPAKLAEAKAKADDIEAKLHAGGDFAQLARSFSDGPTAAQGGDLGEFKRGNLAKVLEDQTFALKSGQFTEPIRTRQGYVILKVDKHVPGGIPPFNEVQDQVTDAYYMSRMEPAIRAYLTRMRDEGYVKVLKAGYTDSGASPGELQQSISFSAYTPPSAKKKKKIQRTRFRENTRTYRQKSSAATTAASEPSTTSAPAAKEQKAAAATTASMKPGKKEKIRFGQAPTKTLPKAPPTTTEDAGAVQVAGSGQEPVNPLESAPPEKKTRFSERAKLPKQPKQKPFQSDVQTGNGPDAAEVADRQTQSAPLGPADASAAKKKKPTTTSDKTRLSEKKKQPDLQKTQTPTPIPPVPGAPAPASATQPAAPAPQQ